MSECRPCAVCKVVFPVAGTWPWVKATRICVPCLRRGGVAPEPELDGPRCSYCNSADGIEVCCPDHAHTLICKWCRPGRPERHKSPFEGMSL